MIINRLNPTTYSNFSIFLINPKIKIPHIQNKILHSIKNTE
ncbi:hypothetical protein EC2864350_0085 [Escherichia coli 2864350]|nr:hypothetical protein EC2780750_0183 [Escherichia coli 2780750]EMX57192.1 hypothetical protein ECMP0209802_0461 [Escherichia coli MP020980.2]ENA99878.1 hypothetical protein EC2864350_0085 [Escherichia coli 2864350]END56713.1 hypothetical protein ECMP0209801_0186 [Escherichia coli MP020980.1]END84398.1 hypothetical protein ECP02994832_0282 [Escherichia coli P0299483.2]END86375.1 hypothetical protein ECP02994833_0071 [Escherichia coli P0299483.3]ESD03683.1 hypothetical protein HMPREF1590_0145